MKGQSIYNTFEQVILSRKSPAQLVEEIHETFYTEVDRLLEAAKISKSTETDKKEMIEKRDRLINMGFTASKNVVEGEEEVKRILQAKIDNAANEKLVRAINYFSHSYPQYKFITEASVKKICAKYNLIYGGVDRYIGTVPDKNLKDIENFKIKEKDECYLRSSRWTRERDYIGYSEAKGKIEPQEHAVSSESSFAQMSRIVGYSISGAMHNDYTISNAVLEIAAPLSDFNMKDHEVKDFKIGKIHVPDPVVLKPVFFEGEKHYLIVTAWGAEASDELVVNQKMN